LDGKWPCLRIGVKETDCCNIDCDPNRIGRALPAFPRSQVIMTSFSPIILGVYRRPH
jgi:hypothetical protein